MNREELPGSVEGIGPTLVREIYLEFGGPFGTAAARAGTRVVATVIARTRRYGIGRSALFADGEGSRRLPAKNSLFQ